MSVASAINSTTSKTCVHDASLLSRTPSWAEIDSPLAHMPGNPETLQALRNFENKQKVGEVVIHDVVLNTANSTLCSFLSLWWFMKFYEQLVMCTLTSLFMVLCEVDFWLENWNFPVNFQQIQIL